MSIVGFTLIEVMIAMTLMSIMMVLLVSSLRTSAESWEIGEKKISQVNENAVVYHFFRRHLSSAKPFSNINEHGEQAFSFQGDADSLQFVSSFPASASRKGLQLFEIERIRKNQGSIQVTISPFFPLTDGQELQREEETLIKQVSDLKISYFSREKPDESGAWQGRWKDKQVLPELVKIKIELNDDRYWPEFIISLKITTANGAVANAENNDNNNDDIPATDLEAEQ
jgi:general secretion pathway protein J